MAWNGTLATKPQRCIAAILSTRTLAEAAAAASARVRQSYRWLKQPDFREALWAAEGNLIDEATRQPVALCNEAVDTLAGLMHDPNESSAVRLRAAQTMLDTALKVRELREVEQRLAAIERTLEG
jgi:hypothetical protein